MPAVKVNDSAKVGRDWFCFSIFKKSTKKADNSGVFRELDDLKEQANELEKRIHKVESQIGLQNDVNDAVTEVVHSLAGEVINLSDRIRILDDSCNRAKNPNP